MSQSRSWPEWSRRSARASFRCCPFSFAGTASGSPRRAYAVIAGLVVSFTAFTLAATVLLSALGLPQDLLRNIAIAVVIVVGLSLVVPRLGHLLERPFYALGRRPPSETGNGFLLGSASACWRRRARGR